MRLPIFQATSHITSAFSLLFRLSQATPPEQQEFPTPILPIIPPHRQAPTLPWIGRLVHHSAALVLPRIGALPTTTSSFDSLPPLEYATLPTQLLPTDSLPDSPPALEPSSQPSPRSQPLSQSLPQSQSPSGPFNVTLSQATNNSFSSIELSLPDSPDVNDQPGLVNWNEQFNELASSPDSTHRRLPTAPPASPVAAPFVPVAAAAAAVAAPAPASSEQDSSATGSWTTRLERDLDFCNLVTERLVTAGKAVEYVQDKTASLLRELAGVVRQAKAATRAAKATAAAREEKEREEKAVDSSSSSSTSRALPPLPLQPPSQNHHHRYPVEYVSETGSDSDDSSAMQPEQYRVGTSWITQKDGLWRAVVEAARQEFERILPREGVTRMEAWDKCRSKWGIIAECIAQLYHVHIDPKDIKRGAVVHQATPQHSTAHNRNTAHS